MLSAVLLDLDDTLYPERAYFESGLDAIATLLSTHVGGEDAAWRTRIAQELAERGRNGILDRLARIVAPDTSTDFSKVLLHAYRTHRPKIDVFEDVPDFLDFCRRKGLLLGIVTDGKSVVQWSKIEALGLEQRVDLVVCTEDIGTAKPDPLPFRIAASRLQVDSRACWYVADDPRKDFTGARGAGLATVRVCRALAYPLFHGGPARAPGDADRIETDLVALMQRIPGGKA